MVKVHDQQQLVDGYTEEMIKYTQTGMFIQKNFRVIGEKLQVCRFMVIQQSKLAKNNNREKT